MEIAWQVAKGHKPALQGIWPSATN